MSACSFSVVESTGAGTEGYSSDTEHATEAVELKIYADEYLQKNPQGSAYGLDVVGEQEMLYQNAGNDKVSFADVVYLPADEVVAAAAADPEADVLVCDTETMEKALDDGIAYGGQVGTSVRSLNAASQVNLVCIRAKGSNAKLPAGDLVNEKDEAGSDGSWANMDQYEGKIAICPENTLQGLSANLLLAENGYYSEEGGTGGKYLKGLAKHVVAAKDADDAISMVKKGKADLALVYTWDINGVKGVEEVVRSFTRTDRTSYKGASLTQSDDGAVARDFLQHWARQV